MTETNYAVAPGAYLEEWIEDHGVSQQHVANLLGCSRKQINELVNGRAPITPHTAVRLERVVGIPADAWLRYEAMYRADLARIKDEEDLASYINQIDGGALAYLRALGATTATKRTPGTLVSDFLAFHRCGTWEAYLHLHESASKGEFALAALKDNGSTLERTLLTTWLRAAELSDDFERGRSYDFDPEGLRATLPAIRERAATPDRDLLRDFRDMLAGVGVVFMIVEPPKKLPLLGMTRWIDKRVPVIQQTGRWGMKDGFVIWTLFHEIGHVLNDPRGEMHLEYKTEKYRNSAAEKLANAFAMNALFGEAGIDPFRGLARDHEIAAAAEAAGLAPGVVVHQLHRRKLLDYRYGNSLSVDLADTISS